MDDVTTSGPIFDGRADGIMDRYCHDTEQVLADRAVNEIRNRLHDVIRVNTGRYEGSIQTDRQVNDVLVTDGGVIYGPWLEGIGSRNSPKTRFPGYSTFRIIAGNLDAEAQNRAEAQLPQYLEELRG